MLIALAGMSQQPTVGWRPPSRRLGVVTVQEYKSGGPQPRPRRVPCECRRGRPWIVVEAERVRIGPRATRQIRRTSRQTGGASVVHPTLSAGRPKSGPQTPWARNRQRFGKGCALHSRRVPAPLRHLAIASPPFDTTGRWRTESWCSTGDLRFPTARPAGITSSDNLHTNTCSSPIESSGESPCRTSGRVSLPAGTPGRDSTRHPHRRSGPRPSLEARPAWCGVAHRWRHRGVRVGVA